MSIRALALHAQRTGHVFAHPITWGRLIRDRGWRRPRLRVYPARPKIGVKATTPNEIWHIDASILRLVDGTRLYLHAVIDNFSRRILGWCVTTREGTQGDRSGHFCTTTPGTPLAPSPTWLYTEDMALASDETISFEEREAEKIASREADERAFNEHTKTTEQLRTENMPCRLNGARIDFTSSTSSLW